MDKIKIISYNAKGLKTSGKRSRVLNWISKKNFDVLALQESHFEDTDMNDWKEHWKGEIISSCGTNDSRGVTFLIPEHLDFELIRKEKDNEGRWIVIEAMIKGTKYCIANYYGPNRDHPHHAEAMLNMVKKFDNLKTIICGDFNFVFNVKLDKCGGNPTTKPQCRKVFLDWMEDKNFQDIWRVKKPIP